MLHTERREEKRNYFFLELRRNNKKKLSGRKISLKEYFAGVENAA